MIVSRPIGVPSYKYPHEPLPSDVAGSNRREGGQATVHELRTTAKTPEQVAAENARAVIEAEAHRSRNRNRLLESARAIGVPGIAKR